MAPVSAIATGALTNLFVLLGLAFLLALGLRAVRRMPPVRATVALGCAFGAMAVGCMLVPFPLTEGTIGDLRNVPVAAAALIGGPWAAAIAAVIAGAYRAALGGVWWGAVGTIASAALVGIAAERTWLPRREHQRVLPLLATGAVLALANAAWALLLPTWAAALFVGEAILAVGLTAYPLGLVLLCRALGAETERLDRVEVLASLNARLAAVNQDLAHAKTAAELADHSKSEFLANMSHELRTPLNAILGFSELIRDRAFGPGATDRYAAYAADIHASGRHLLTIIDDLLDLSRIESGRFVLEEAETAPGEAVAAAVGLVAGRAADKGLRLDTVLDPALPATVNADARALRQIVLNLVGNAVKFTPAPGRVTVRAGPDRGGGLEIAVEDTGPGIPGDLVDRLMQPFELGAPSLVRRQQGVGLGLPIVRRLVLLHGGDLRLDSTPGRGTRAVVTLPARRAGAERTAA